MESPAYSSFAYFLWKVELCCHLWVYISKQKENSFFSGRVGEKSSRKQWITKRMMWQHMVRGCTCFTFKVQLCWCKERGMRWVGWRWFSMKVLNWTLLYLENCRMTKKFRLWVFYSNFSPTEFQKDPSRGLYNLATSGLQVCNTNQTYH